MSDRRVVVLVPHPRGVSVPAGLLYVGGALRRAGFEVCVSEVPDLEPREVAARRPLFVGMGPYSAPGIAAVAGLSRELRRRGVRVVWGGPHATLRPVRTLASGVCDALIRGSGEAPVVELAKAWCEGREPGKVPGLMLPAPGGTGGRGVEPWMPTGAELDALDPGWDLIDLEPYVESVLDIRRVLQVPLGRGCPYRCSFCAAPGLHGGRVVRHGHEHVASSVARLKNRYGIDGVEITDDLVGGPDDPGVQALAKAGLKWLSHFHVRQLDRRVLGELISLGCRGIKIGGEAGSDHLLAACGKGITTGEVERVVREAGELGLTVWATFILGLPGETATDRRELFAFVHRLSRHNRRLYATAGIYTPYPCTGFWEESLSLGFREPQEPEGWEVADHHSCNIPWVDPARTEVDRLVFNLAHAVGPESLARLALRGLLPDCLHGVASVLGRAEGIRRRAVRRLTVYRLSRLVSKSS